MKSMKHVWVALCVAAVGATSAMAPMDAEARRLGGGRPAGMQRRAPPPQPAQPPAKQAQPNQPANQAATAPGAAPVPATAPARRSWLGPIAGLAAGLGIAALMSHLGLGPAFGNLLTILLLAVVGIVVVRWLMRRFAAPGAAHRLAGASAGAGMGGAQPRWTDASPQPTAAQGAGPMLHREALGRQEVAHTAGQALAPTALPPGFDAADFARTAKMIFIRLQAANDEANVDDLRRFTTPELFASLRLDLQERGPAPQRTDVLQLDADLVDTAQEEGHWVASVRFHGLIREEPEAGAERFNELWHLVKPVNGEREWAIAGITPLDAPAAA